MILDTFLIFNDNSGLNTIFRMYATHVYTQYSKLYSLKVIAFESQNLLKFTYI